MPEPVIQVSFQQFREGWAQSLNGQWVTRPYQLVQQLPSGACLVVDPAFMGILNPDYPAADGG